MTSDYVCKAQLSIFQAQGNYLLNGSIYDDDDNDHNRKEDDDCYFILCIKLIKHDQIHPLNELETGKLHVSDYFLLSILVILISSLLMSLLESEGKNHQTTK